MAMPTDIGVIDTHMGIPPRDKVEAYGFFRDMLHDEGSKDMTFPAEYMFKDYPTYEGETDMVAFVLRNMDEVGVARSMINIRRHDTDPNIARAHQDHSDRFFYCWSFSPHEGTPGIAAMKEAKQRFDIRAAICFPCGLNPQVGISDALMYPWYAACCELDIAVCINAGVPGPRLPLWPQKVELIDSVMYDFPDLRFVTRHGCEPWTALAVKLMLKWPNLYYSTSAFAPKYYPADIVDYANTRGGDKIIYAGYFPDGLSLQRIFRELPGVPFRDHVWPLFLRDNAASVFQLD
jgi:predicted TIM-barrel fold metal-dependent hydrolase